MKLVEKIFLVKGKEKVIDGFEFVKPLGDFVELTEKQLELINWSLATNKEDFEQEGCLPKHKIMFDRLTELIKKLKKLTEKETE